MQRLGLPLFKKEGMLLPEEIKCIILDNHLIISIK
jgi:hypothetical protein